MKVRALVMASLSTLMLSFPAGSLLAQEASPTGSPAAFGDSFYDQLVESSRHWEQIDGISVDPKLGIRSFAELTQRLEEGHVLTTVDPSTGAITRVTEPSDAYFWKD